MKPKSPLLAQVGLGTAIAIAACVGYVDQHNDEVWAALILILSTTFALGFILPRYGWLWAFLIGGSVPVAALIGWGIGYVPPCHPGIVCPPSNVQAMQSTVALIPAFIGAYAGALFRCVISLANEAQPSQG